jgi:hypothetical protein
MPRTTTKIRTSQPPPPMNTYTNHYPQVQITKPQLQSSFLGTMAEGFSFGVGSSVARHAVDSIFSSATLTHSHPPPQLPEPEKAEKMIKLYNDCMLKATSPDDIEKCEKYNIHNSSQR